MKTFKVITSIARVFSLLGFALGVVGAVMTGLYPGFLVLIGLAIIPLASRSYVKQKIEVNTGASMQNHWLLTGLNFLVILVVIWMSFVILIDRVIPAFEL